MFHAVVFVCLLATSWSFNIMDLEWELYKSSYGKKYEPHVEKIRRYIWEDNMKFIKQHNMEATRGLHTYILGMNKYGDMTNTEFVNTMNGYKQNVTSGICKKYTTSPKTSMTSLPASVDWRDKGYVTGVKDQGQCGSCWSFSSTGSLEGQNFKKTGKLVSLSEQNLIDCSTGEGNDGCNGGLMDQAFAYVIKNGGIDTEASYPYVAKEGPCKYNTQNIGAAAKGCKDIKAGSETELQSAVAAEGPISVAIDASHTSFQFYKSGVYNEVMCSTIKLNHAVLVVGYGSLSNIDYWLVKNSWGESWGQNGYIMMSRNKNNQCGIASMATFPIM